MSHTRAFANDQADAAARWLGSRLAGQAYLQPLHAGELDLRWTLDEADWLDPPLEKIWEKLCGAGPLELAAVARHYSVDDPYGCIRAAPVLARHFECNLSPEHVTFGAGSSSLLRDCVALAGAGPILTCDGTHPDLEAWAWSAAIPIHALPLRPNLEQWIAAAGQCSPKVVHFDRPNQWGDIPTLADVRHLCRSLADSLIIIDEAYATYLPSRQSVVSMVLELPNLIVVRSMSKGYCCGGLRVGYVVADKDVSLQLRRCVAPLQVSELPFQLALLLLGAGDLFSKLRSRVVKIKPRLAALLSGMGMRIHSGHPELPWILIDDSDGEAQKRLRACGVAVKPCEFGPDSSGSEDWIRIAVPLSQPRVTEMEQRLKRISSDETLPNTESCPS